MARMNRATLVTVRDGAVEALSRPFVGFRSETVLAVLGMHRSGTSVTTGMLEDQGIDTGPTIPYSPDNVRGNRENPRLGQLHESILERNGGSWWHPPDGSIAYRRRDTWQRDRILSAYQGSVIAVKDPRMLLLMELWRDLDSTPIGVIRNPVAVRRSLQRRWRRGIRYGARQLSDDDCDRLWHIYNGKLLEERRRREFPIINFDEQAALHEQVRAALSFYGIESPHPFSFFETNLVSSDTQTQEWRSDIVDQEIAELWDALDAYSMTAAEA